jgi:glutathione synthase/RimK-type ligase-like ATP-grasp enzyme
LEEYIRKN